MVLDALAIEVFYRHTLVPYVEIIPEETVRTSMHWKAACAVEILHTSQRRICHLSGRHWQFCCVIQSLLILL
jgi:hypothetical protein